MKAPILLLLCALSFSNVHSQHGKASLRTSKEGRIVRPTGNGRISQVWSDSARVQIQDLEGTAKRHKNTSMVYPVPAREDKAAPNRMEQGREQHKRQLRDRQSQSIKLTSPLPHQQRPVFQAEAQIATNSFSRNDKSGLFHNHAKNRKEQTAVTISGTLKRQAISSERDNFTKNFELRGMMWFRAARFLRKQLMTKSGSLSLLRSKPVVGSLDSVVNTDPIPLSRPKKSVGTDSDNIPRSHNHRFMTKPLTADNGVTQTLNPNSKLTSNPHSVSDFVSFNRPKARASPVQDETLGKENLLSTDPQKNVRRGNTVPEPQIKRVKESLKRSQQSVTVTDTKVSFKNNKSKTTLQESYGVMKQVLDTSQHKSPTSNTLAENDIAKHDYKVNVETTTVLSKIMAPLHKEAVTRQNIVEHSAVTDQSDFHAQALTKSEPNARETGPLHVTPVANASEERAGIDWERVSQMCNHSTCNKRCGQRHEIMCSCDSLCVLFRDCCQDFAEACPSLSCHNQTSSEGNHSVKATAECDSVNKDNNDETTTMKDGSMHKANGSEDSDDNHSDGDETEKITSTHFPSTPPTSFFGGSLNQLANLTEMELNSELQLFQNSFNMECMDSAVAFRGCTQRSDDIDVSLLQRLGLAVTSGVEVRRKCLTQSHTPSLSESIVTRGTRPSGITLDYTNPFCAVCSGSVAIQPLGFLLICITPLHLPLNPENFHQTTMSAGCRRMWQHAIKQCSFNIPLSTIEGPESLETLMSGAPPFPPSHSKLSLGIPASAEKDVEQKKNATHVPCLSHTCNASSNASPAASPVRSQYPAHRSSDNLPVTGASVPRTSAASILAGPAANSPSMATSIPADPIAASPVLPITTCSNVSHISTASLAITSAASPALTDSPSSAADSTSTASPALSPTPASSSCGPHVDSDSVRDTDRRRLATLCHSLFAYVHINGRVFRNKYCYLTQHGASVSSPCTVAQKYLAIIRIGGNFGFYYRVDQVLTNPTVTQQLKKSQRPNSNRPKSGLRSSMNEAALTSDAPLNCTDDYIQTESECLPVLYSLRLMLEVNFTAPGDGPFRSSVADDDMDNITHNLLHVMETDNNVTACRTGKTTVWRSSEAFPHHWAQLMAFSCHVRGVQSSSLLHTFQRQVSHRLNSSFSGVVELGAKPADIIVTACVTPSPLLSPTTIVTTTTTKVYCSEMYISVKLEGNRGRTRSVSVEGYISIACCLLSDLGLFLRIALQRVVPCFNSFPGRIQLCLCVTLALAYSFFLVGGLVEPGSTSCQVVGVATHLSFLSALFWMNMTAYEIWKTFRDWKCQIKTHSRASLVLRGLFAVGIPLAIVGGAVLMDVLQPNHAFSPRYGLDNCWLNRPYAIVCYFVFPCSLICFLNIYFMAFTVRGLRQQRHNMTPFRKDGKPSPVNEVVISVKILLMVGITWLLGLLAFLLDVEALWIIFTLVNASLGFCIAAVLLCNHSVMSILMRTCRTESQETNSAAFSTQKY